MVFSPRCSVRSPPDLSAWGSCPTSCPVPVLRRPPRRPGPGSRGKASWGPTTLEAQEDAALYFSSIDFVWRALAPSRRDQRTSAEISIPQEEGAVDPSEHPAHRSNVEQTHQYQHSTIEPGGRHSRCQLTTRGTTALWLICTWQVMQSVSTTKPVVYRVWTGRPWWLGVIIPVQDLVNSFCWLTCRGQHVIQALQSGGVKKQKHEKCTHTT